MRNRFEEISFISLRVLLINKNFFKNVKSLDCDLKAILDRIL